MAIHVPKQKDEIEAFLRKAFSDYYSFDLFLNAGLSNLIDDILACRISHQHVTIKSLMDRYSSSSLEKNASDQMKILLCSCYLALIQHREEFAHLMMNQSEFLERYPSFANEDSQEIGYMQTFRNLLVTALTFIPAKGNKILLIKVIERLEGSNNEYVTGSGQKPAVTRRVQIYETEGHVRAKRKADGNDCLSSKRALVNDGAGHVIPQEIAHPTMITSIVPQPILPSSYMPSVVTDTNSKAVLEEAMILFPTLKLQRMETFDLDNSLCCDLQPDLSTIMKDFAYSGAITEDVFGILREFEDANLAKWA